MTCGFRFGLPVAKTLAVILPLLVPLRLARLCISLLHLLGLTMLRLVFRVLALFLDVSRAFPLTLAFGLPESLALALAFLFNARP